MLSYPCRVVGVGLVPKTAEGKIGFSSVYFFVSPFTNTNLKVVTGICIQSLFILTLMINRFKLNVDVN